MSLVPNLPVSLNELAGFYRTTIAEIDFIEPTLERGLEYIEFRLKPSPLVSVTFNKYEHYYKSCLEHLKWRVSPLLVDEAFEFGKSAAVEKLLKHEFELSGVAHPIDEQEILPMLESMRIVRSLLKAILEDIEASMLQSIFLCHASADKPQVRRIAEGLIKRGSRVWLDEAEILVGDSLIEKIQSGIEESNFLGIVMSPRSVESIWVKKEVEAALTQEIDAGRVKVLPILIEDCDIPLFLKPKKYADFRTDDQFTSGLEQLVARLKA
ncbi:MAG: toll/interleukin-1 receptor domain-containing protein [Pseudomonadota bacterium]